MTRNRFWTSSWSSTADGSSMISSRASWESARAMLTICWRGRRQPADLAGRRDLGVAEPLQQLADAPVARCERWVNPPRGDLVAEEDVLGDGQARRPGRAPGRSSRCRGCIAAVGVRQRDRLAAPADLALVGLVRAGQHLDQRRLAGAVLAEQAVHLAGADVEVDAAERPHARELLHDAAHLEQSPGPGTAVVGAAVVGRCHLAAPLRTVPAPPALIRRTRSREFGQRKPCDLRYATNLHTFADEFQKGRRARFRRVVRRRGPPRRRSGRGRRVRRWAS